MRKAVSLFLVALFAAAVVASAHEGHAHSLLGTVKEVQDGHVIVTTKDGKEVTVHLTGKTKYQKAGKPGARADLAPGARVSVQMQKDGKSAATVKIGAAREK